MQKETIQISRFLGVFWLQGNETFDPEKAFGLSVVNGRNIHVNEARTGKRRKKRTTFPLGRFQSLYSERPYDERGVVEIFSLWSSCVCV